MSQADGRKTMGCLWLFLIGVCVVLGLVTLLVLITADIGPKIISSILFIASIVLLVGYTKKKSKEIREHNADYERNYVDSIKDPDLQRGMARKSGDWSKINFENGKGWECPICFSLIQAGEMECYNCGHNVLF